jgi:hypothetical protein
MSDCIKQTIYDDLTNKVIEKVTYDNTQLLKQNAMERVERQGSNKYRGNLVKVASLHWPGDFERLRNIGYNLLSSDPDEVRRALLYVQSEEKAMLVVDGTPFAKKRAKWV